MKRTLAVYNLGCSKNLVDGDTISGYMAANGFQLIADFSLADVIIVNTCTFIEEATKEAIDTILQLGLLKETRLRTLVVSGCFSQRYRDEVAKDFPEVDLWLGTKTWIEELAVYFQLKDTGDFDRVLSEPRHTQYLKISEGCSHACTFCIIPHIRGSFQSRTIEDLVKEAQWLESQGVKELIVVSQDTTYYGRDRGETLRDLLQELVSQTTIPWIRMMYLHPALVTDALLEFVAEEPRLCPYFDIPLQHAADSVLKRMGRKPGNAGLYDLVERIRRIVPNATIRTSFVVGFPGETEEDFETLMDFVRWARFDKMGVFPFSPEEGTVAHGMDNHIAAKIVTRRCDELMVLQQDMSRALQEQHLDTECTVLVDRVSDFPDYTFECRTMGDAPEVDGRVFLLDGDASPGDLLRVRIVDCDDYDLIGEMSKA